jgi:hypothetical protein
MEAIDGMCRKACGDRVDSSCVTSCGVGIYKCMDVNRHTPTGKRAYEACEDAQMAKYKAFGKHWDSKHPY